VSGAGSGSSMAVIRKPAVVKALIIAGSGRCHSVSTQLWPLGVVVSAEYW
jgi:hypothetical protein